jgi:hypothetical protein
MDEQEIKSLVEEMDTASSAAEEAVWSKLRPLGKDVLPYLLEFFPRAKKWQSRRAIVFHAINHARTSEDAFKLGLAAIKDKSTMVRYRGCCVLANSLREDAIPHLIELLDHKDSKTVEDARAAIDAIKNQNHQLFYDRTHSGKIVWSVNDENEPHRLFGWINKLFKK